MDKFNLIIDENQSLYEILKESNIVTHYQLILSNNNISELILKSNKDNLDYLILTSKKNFIYDSKKTILIDKPINIKTLLEKINLSISKNKFSTTSNISVGRYSIDLNSRKIYLDGESLKLTEKEIELIMYLNESKIEKKSNEISKFVWGHSDNVETHTVETHIYRLRKKITDKFNDSLFIISNNNGYKIK